MAAESRVNGYNPLEDLVSDDVYTRLRRHDLLSDKAVRNYQMRRRFQALRARDVPAQDAIEALQETYSYLQFDTIRKIVYRVNG